MASWSKENILEFIERYRKEEALWKVKSKDYSNRMKKEDAYTRLLEYVKTFDSSLTREGVVRKISNLRNVFRRELKKKRQSQKSGIGAEDVYSPRLWYFSYLNFLTDGEETRTPISSVGESMNSDLDHSVSQN